MNDQSLRPMLQKTVDQISAKVRDALKCGRAMVAVWRFEGGRIYLERDTINFPVDSLYGAIDTLVQDLEAEHAKFIHPGSLKLAPPPPNEALGNSPEQYRDLENEP